VFSSGGPKTFRLHISLQYVIVFVAFITEPLTVAISATVSDVYIERERERERENEVQLREAWIS
jgi:hypothetical protein